MYETINMRQHCNLWAKQQGRYTSNYGIASDAAIITRAMNVDANREEASTEN